MNTDLSLRPRGPAAPATAADFRHLLGSFRDRFDDELATWLSRRQAESSAATPEAVELTGKLDRYVLRGGKRLRPALVHYAFRGCGGERWESVLPACLAVELLHTYLLIHDDIMDHAETRRRGPSAHRLFRDEHRERGWPGDSDHHGLSVAILLGDLAHTYADELFASCAAPGAAGERARGCYSAMCREVIIGQYLEMTAGYRDRPSEEDLLEVLRLKSGLYSVERPIQLGALLAGAAEETVSALSRFGSGMGEAFQLQDDLLGMFGDRDEVGKPVGGDLVEGKYTVLIFHTVRDASTEDRRAVLAALGNPDLEPAEVDRVREIIRASGAEARVGSMIDERLRGARGALDKLALRGEARNFFQGLIEYFGERKR